MISLRLNEENWDLVTDRSANLAIVSDNERIAQDVATATRVWLGEAWNDVEIGVPYETVIFARNPPPSLVKEYIRKTALTVEGVERISVELGPTEDRKQSGRIRINEVIDVRI